MIELNFQPGDVIRVHQKIKEGDPSKDSGQVKERIQVFEGIVLSIRGQAENKSFTVRKVVDGMAVERIWPLNSPLLIKVEIKAKPKKRFRRAKLYYLRKTS